MTKLNKLSDESIEVFKKDLCEDCPDAPMDECRVGCLRKAIINKLYSLQDLQDKIEYSEPVEVVRCKDCGKWKERVNNKIYCVQGIEGVGYKLMDDNEFCSYGERSIDNA